MVVGVDQRREHVVIEKSASRLLARDGSGHEGDRGGDRGHPRRPIRPATELLPSLASRIRDGFDQVAAARSDNGSHAEGGTGGQLGHNLLDLSRVLEKEDEAIAIVDEPTARYGLAEPAEGGLRDPQDMARGNHAAIGWARRRSGHDGTPMRTRRRPGPTLARPIPTQWSGPVSRQFPLS